jgi:hypothetical protein
MGGTYLKGADSTKIILFLALNRFDSSGGFAPVSVPDVFLNPEFSVQIVGR